MAAASGPGPPSEKPWVEILVSDDDSFLSPVFAHHGHEQNPTGLACGQSYDEGEGRWTSVSLLLIASDIWIEVRAGPRSEAIVPPFAAHAQSQAEARTQ